MTNTMDILPLSCSCSNCDWNFCTMKTKINKNILVCCCGENNTSQQFVYTCTTCSIKKAANSIKEPETCSVPNDVKKPCDKEKGRKSFLEDVKKSCDKKKDRKSLPTNELIKSLNDNIDTKQSGNKFKKRVKLDCVSKQCTPKSGKIYEVIGGKNNGIKDKKSIVRSETKRNKNDLYSKIEEIYTICYCELCDCPSSHDTTYKDENLLDLEEETKHVCLCFENRKEASENNKDDIGCECPLKEAGPGMPKPCECNAVNGSSKSSVPIKSITPCGDKNENVSPRPSETDVVTPRPKNHPKELKKVNLVCSKYSCSQLNSQENDKDDKIISPIEEERNKPDSDNETDYYVGCPCYHKNVDTEAKNEGKNCIFPITDSLVLPHNLDYSITDHDISEDGDPTCACEPDDKKDMECPCYVDEMPKTNTNKMTTGETCRCNSCVCVNCPNASKNGESKDKGKGILKKKLCKCTKCFISKCRMNRNNCICEGRKASPNRKRKSNSNIRNYDICRALLYESLPFNRIANDNSFSDANVTQKMHSSVSCSFKDSCKREFRDCYIFKSNLYEYGDITREFDNHCACSLCECQFCDTNVTKENRCLRKFKACQCAKCDCISCSALLYDNHQIFTNDMNFKKQTKLQNSKEKVNDVKLDYSDILYENLRVLKKGEILLNFKSDKEKLENDQIGFGINRGLPLRYVVGDEKKILVTEHDYPKHTLGNKKSVKKKSKENVKANKNGKIIKELCKNRKECLNIQIPSHSGFIQKSLMILNPENSDFKKENDADTIRKIKIYTKLKSLCDNADEYIKHLKDLLERTKKDNEYFEMIIENIKTIDNTSNPIMLKQ